MRYAKENGWQKLDVVKYREKHIKNYYVYCFTTLKRQEMKNLSILQRKIFRYLIFC